MHNINLSSNDASVKNNQPRQNNIPHTEHKQEIGKTDIKPTQIVQATQKADTKTIDNKTPSIVTENKQLRENIAQEKLSDKSFKPQETKQTTSLEVKNTYTEQSTQKTDTSEVDIKGDGIETPTALEVAVKQKDVLESVKSVKPDGTETYYFPVPVEVLTQLPPPGNIGLSEKMLADILKNSSEDKKSDTDKITVNLKENDAKKIYVEAVNKKQAITKDETDKDNKTITERVTEKTQQSDNKTSLFG